jgi:hypothetical protein
MGQLTAHDGIAFAEAWHGLVEHVRFGGVGGDVIIDELPPLVVAGAEELWAGEDAVDEDDIGGEDEGGVGEDTGEDDTLTGEVVIAATLEHGVVG